MSKISGNGNVFSINFINRLQGSYKPLHEQFEKTKNS